MPFMESYKMPIKSKNIFKHLKLKLPPHLLPGAGKPDGGPHTANGNPGAKPEASEHENLLKIRPRDFG